MNMTSTPAWTTEKPTALLVLADGTVIEGKGIGATGKVTAEVCFNTALTGYQEILTDPSYLGQIVTFTFPHIGNIGANNEDIEDLTPAARHGAVLEDLAERWLEGGHANEIDAVTASWIRAFLASVEDRELAAAAVQQFFAWAGNQTQPGGFYRVRYTGKPVHLPVGLNAGKNSVTITFSGALDPKTATDPKNYAVRTWSLKRSAEYGSKHYDEKAATVTAAKLSADGKTVTLEIADLKPTWGMEIKYAVQASDGSAVQGVLHNTIHRLGE